jgi:hypothetical protein
MPSAPNTVEIDPRYAAALGVPKRVEIGKLARAVVDACPELGLTYPSTREAREWLATLAQLVDHTTDNRVVQVSDRTRFIVNDAMPSTPSEGHVQIIVGLGLDVPSTGWRHDPHHDPFPALDKALRPIARKLARCLLLLLVENGIVRRV